MQVMINARKQKSLPVRAWNLTKDSALCQCLGPALISSDTPVASWHNEQEVFCQFSKQCNTRKCKAILVTGSGGPLGCETSRLPHFLDNRLTDGGVSLMRWPPFTPRKIPGTHFCQRLSRPHGHSEAESTRSIEKCNDFTGNRTRDLPPCSVVLPSDGTVSQLNHLTPLIK
jgi:hypothetical protein